MNCLGPGYNPKPPRTWTRVQNPCTFNLDSPINVNELLIEQQMLLKGNILQYKKNSSNLTKQQRYSQIAKGSWTNRTKSWATQSQTYTNPNTSSLKQVNYTSVPLLEPTTNQFGCVVDYIKNGGVLLGNTTVNPCTDEIIKTTYNNPYSLTTSSNVPGPTQSLYWDNTVQTWYPRQNLTMNTSSDKWPTNYKGLVSANELKSGTKIINVISEPTILPTYIPPNQHDCHTIIDSSGNAIDVATFCAYFDKFMNSNDALYQINGYLNTFITTNGNIEMSFDTYNELNVNLVKIKNGLPNASCLSDIIDTYGNILDVLKEYINKSTLLEGMNTLVDKYKGDSETLNDTQKLQEFLNNLRKNMNNILEELIITSVEMPTIKPLYAKYHEYYGIPDDLDYDPEKLLLLQNTI